MTRGKDVVVKWSPGVVRCSGCDEVVEPGALDVVRLEMGNGKDMYWHTACLQAKEDAVKLGWPEPVDLLDSE